MKPEPATQLGQNIADALAHFRLSLLALSDRSGVHVYSIVRIARGDYEPKLATVCALAAGLNCETWELLKPGHFANRRIAA